MFSDRPSKNLALVGLESFVEKETHELGFGE